MAYILAKQSTLNGVKRNLYYIVESYRENGKVKRETVLGLGEANNVDELIQRLNNKEKEIKAEIGEIDHDIKVDRYWKHQRIFQKRIARVKLELEKLEQFQEKVREVKQTYKM